MSSSKKVLAEFAYKLKFRNDLPDVPFDPKLLEHPFAEDRLYKYTPNTLHATTPCAMYMPHDDNGMVLGLLANGLLAQEFRRPHELRRMPNPDSLDEADRALLAQPREVVKDAPARERPVVPWLRRTEYIAATSRSFGRNADEGVETKMGVSIMKDNRVRQLLSRSKDAQMDAIEATFDHAARASLATLRHPTKKDVTPLEIFPIFPDFEFWPNQYLLASYDEDPTTVAGGSGAAAAAAAEHEHELKAEEAVLKPLQNPADPSESWLAFYTPKDASADRMRDKRNKRKRRIEMGGDEDDEDDDDEDEIDQTVYEYEFRRDFEPSIGPSNYPFFLELRTEAGGAFYSQLRSKMALRKKRALNKLQRSFEDEIEKPTKVLVTLREFEPEELEERKAQMRALLHEDDVDDE
ncbi:RNA polymerase-associated factor [Polyrhizophydium stewartii]|uniref:RNA polymerase-associated factor n=1 Tax=Polyrhizophydium stewartii TaxID=2732419 RepID=A0ABR4N6L7_9FUNG